MQKPSISKLGPTLVLGLASTVLAVGFVACSGSGGGPTAPSLADDAGSFGDGSDGGTTESVSGDDKGTLQISMKDAPIDDVAELLVYVAGLRIKPSGEPVQDLATDISPNPTDLLLLQDDVSQILAQTEVSATTYQFIEILLDQDMSSVVELDGDVFDLQIASEKIKLKGGPFNVCEGGVTSVLFDFDAEKSLKLRGNGEYLLTPILKIEEIVEGECAGVVGADEEEAEDEDSDQTG